MSALPDRLVQTPVIRVKILLEASAVARSSALSNIPYISTKDRKINNLVNRAMQPEK